MTRILVVHERGGALPTAPKGVTLTGMPLPNNEHTPDQAVAHAMAACRDGQAEAVVVILPAERPQDTSGTVITAILEGSAVPTVLCSARKLHDSPGHRDSGRAGEPETLATAVVHGFGARTADLALRAAVQLVQQQAKV